MNVKRIMLLMGVMLLAVALPVLPVAADNGTAITVDAPAEVSEGGSFVARVNISDVTNLYAAEYTVSFDDTVLELVDVTAGDVGGVAFGISAYNSAIYRVVQQAPSIAGVSGSGYLAELHFNVIGSAGDTSAIDLTDRMLASTEAEAIPATWTAASVGVVALDQPVVITNAASAVTHDSATLHGNLDSLGDYTEVRVRFQWGTTAAYGNNTPWQVRTAAGAFSSALAGLAPESQYHFRVQVETVAPSNTVTDFGADMTFTTGEESDIPPVGGTAHPISRLPIVAIWIAIGAAIIAGASLLMRHRRAQS